MLFVNDVFSKSYKIYNQNNFNGFSKSIVINNLNNFSFKSLRKIKYITLLDNTITFESIVNFLSSCEDLHSLDLLELNIDINGISNGNKLFFELLDFYYGYDNLKMNIVSDLDSTPFEIVHNVFYNYEINNFHNFGLSLNIDSLNDTPWFDSTVLRTIVGYINNGFSVSDEKYYLR